MKGAWVKRIFLCKLDMRGCVLGDGQAIADQQINSRERYFHVF